MNRIQNEDKKSKIRNILENKLQFYQPIRIRVVGLVVKFVVAIDEPGVRFPHNAICFLLFVDFAFRFRVQPLYYCIVRRHTAKLVERVHVKQPLNFKGVCAKSTRKEI